VNREIPPRQFSTRRVLVVEDQFLIRLDLLSVLEEHGAIVIPAASVAQGLAALATATFDVAVLDVHLPDGEVFPVAKQLCERGIPIIFHSGQACAANLMQSFPTAIALSKPASDYQIVTAVNSLLPALFSD
jgi:CheY-like chemotaxis protein